MVESFGIPQENIGYYVGFIASSFSLAQFLTSFFWGYLSDRIGRRPVLLLGLFGNSVTMVMFGFSHSLKWAITTRSLCGFLNGNIGVAKSVLGEITTTENRGAAFSLLGLNFGIGLIIGPSLGGLLSWPAKHIPIFKGIAFFEDNPFLLPCLLSSFISAVGFIIGLLFLPETLQNSEFSEELDRNDLIQQDITDNNHDLDSHSHESGLYIQENNMIECNLATETEPLITKENQPKIGSASIQAAIAYAILAFGNIIFSEVFPLWAVATPPVGLGFTAVDIGLLLSSVGVVAIVCQLFIYPPISRRYSALILYKVPMPILFIVYAIMPLIPYLFAGTPFLWPVVIFFMGCKSIVENFLFTSVMILVSDILT